MCFIVSPGRGWRGVDGRDVVQRPNVAHFSFSLFWPSLFSHPLIRSLVCRLFSSRVCLAYTLRSATNCQSYPRTKPKQCCQTSATHSPDPFAFRLFSNAKYFAYRVLSRVCEAEKPQGLFPCLETISRFSCGKRCFKLSYIQSLNTLKLIF